jgi:hypothetical protein
MCERQGLAMPITTFLFALGQPELERALLAHPRWSRASFRLDSSAAGLRVPPEGLLAVDLEDAAFAALWEGEGEPEQPALPVLAAATRRYGWLDRVLPPPAEVQALQALSVATGRSLAWFYWWERGDDLYADAALLLSPKRHVALVRETGLMGGPSAASWRQEAGAVEEWVWDGSPFQEAMAHLGLASGTQYFQPADDSRFPWAEYRLHQEV